MRTDACTCTWMPRASIHASSTPRGCLSIFNLSIESASGRDIIAAGSIPRSTKGLDRIEIFEDEEPLGIPRRLVSKIYFRQILRSPRAVTAMPPPRYCCHACRADRSVFYTMLIAISPTLCYVFVLLVKGWNVVRVGIIYGCIGDRIIHFVEEGIEGRVKIDRSFIAIRLLISIQENSL